MINSAQPSPLLQEIARNEFITNTASNQKKMQSNSEFSAQSDFCNTESVSQQNSALKARREGKAKCRNLTFFDYDLIGKRLLSDFEGGKISFKSVEQFVE